MAVSKDATFSFPADVSELTRRYFEPRLVDLGLSEQQIASQTLAELRQSLERVNDAIAHPESFGVLKLKTAGSVFVVSTEAHVEVGILPLLLDRKKRIIDRTAILSGASKLEDLRNLTDKTPDNAIREQLQTKLTELESDFRQWREQAIAADDAKHDAEANQKLQLAQVEIYERKSRVWQSFLERQSVATILGALLLLGTFIFLVAAAGLNIAVPELIRNAFLVILGYFFGQGGSGRNSSAGGTNTGGA